MALAIAVFGAGRLAAETDTFQLFPSAFDAPPLVSPADAEGPQLRFRDGMLLPRAVEVTAPQVRETSATRMAGLRPYVAAFVALSCLGYSAGNSLQEGYTGRFHFANEGFFGRNTYTGGADKAAHLVDYNVVARGLRNIYREIGYSEKRARWMGFATAFATGLVTEAGDGTTYFGFSYEDLVFDALGAATAIGLAESGWEDTFGFRLGSISQDPTPACCVDNSNVGRDYSGEIYVADVKLSGLARRLKVNPGPARFLLLSATYGTNGYNHGSPEIRQRLIGIELGVNFSEILRALGVPEKTIWGEALYFFFETIRIANTAIGFRYDLNHAQWFGPTTGRTPFRVSAGAR